MSFSTNSPATSNTASGKPQFSRKPALESAALEFMPPDKIKATTVKKLELLVQQHEQKQKTADAAASSAATHPGANSPAPLPNGTAVVSDSRHLGELGSLSLSSPPYALTPTFAHSEPVALSRPYRSDVFHSASFGSSSHGNSLGAGVQYERTMPFSAPPPPTALAPRHTGGDTNDALNEIIDEIEAQFSDCHILIPRCIKQVQMLRSPQQHEVLAQYFSHDERARILHSVKLNSKDAYWSLYRIISDVYQYRSDTIQELNQGQLLTSEAQAFFLEKQQVLFDLLTRYKQLIEVLEKEQ